MPIRPIDVKTPVASSHESTRLRESQKAQEGGQDQFAAQNVRRENEKFETVTGTREADGKVIRKEDEEGEKKKRPAPEPKKPLPSEGDEPAGEPAEPTPNDPDRGRRIDLKI